jgi:DNA topoisomerase I
MRDGSKLFEIPILRRIKALAIPPAWANVWICPTADGHVQATGRDARGRKQYRYHPRFREVRESTKYEHVVAFC